MNTLKQAAKKHLSFFIGLRHFARFVSVRFIAPKRRGTFGRFGSTTLLKTPAVITCPQNVFLSDDVHIREGLQIINYTGKVVIKKFVGIAPDCTIVTGNHCPTVGVPHFLGGPCHINDNEKGVTIDEGVWIGTRVTLLAGAHVGRGAVIGACSLVNKDIPPYAVAVGSPAKVIASVFTLEQILEHERLLYPEEERFPREYLEELFATHYAGRKAIGKSTISDADLQKVRRGVLAMHHPIQTR